MEGRRMAGSGQLSLRPIVLAGQRGNVAVPCATLGFFVLAAAWFIRRQTNVNEYVQRHQPPVNVHPAFPALAKGSDEPPDVPPPPSIGGPQSQRLPTTSCCEAGQPPSAASPSAEVARQCADLHFVGIDPLVEEAAG